jgi:hypothetical protein
VNNQKPSGYAIRRPYWDICPRLDQSPELGIRCIGGRSATNAMLLRQRIGGTTMTKPTHNRTRVASALDNLKSLRRGEKPDCCCHSVAVMIARHSSGRLVVVIPPAVAVPGSARIRAGRGDSRNTLSPRRIASSMSWVTSSVVTDRLSTKRGYLVAKAGGKGVVERC